MNQVIVIGAGLAGLATGCYAQMNGYRSQIFEYHTQPGGVAAAWRRDGYLIDGGIHFVMNHRPGTELYEMYRELGIVPDVQFVDMTTYGLFVDELAGIEVRVTRDLDRLAQDLKERSPADERIIDELIKGTRAMQGTDMSQAGMGKPPELMSPPDQLRDLWTMRRLLPYAMGRFGQPIAAYARAAQAPWLRNLLENLFLPEAPVYFICMILALLADGQMGFIDGSCLDVVQAIDRRYRALGGSTVYRAKVDEILVEDDAAVGVRLSDGSERRADAVVSAADGYSTIFHMLGGQYVNDKIVKRYETWPRFRPLLMASYGVAREFPNEPAFSTVSLNNPFTIGGQPVAAIMVRIFNYSPKFAPPGKSVIQVELETEWEYWNDLQERDRAAYDVEKARVAAEALQRLEARFPGLSSQVEVTDVVTPYTFWRYTLNDKGAWEGWLMTPDAMRTSIKRTLPGLDRFFMAGQWVTPGGGVPPVLYTGQHAVQLLCRQDGKPFSTTTSQTA